MKRGQVLVLVGILFLAGMVMLGLGLWLRADALPPNAPLAASPDAAAMATDVMNITPAEELPLAAMPAQDSALPPLPEWQAEATQSMSNAREQGDARQPALQRDAPRELPNAQELADPEAYQRYETRQNQRLHKAYVKAAEAEIPRLQKDIEQARAAGMTPAQIAEGEEKLRRIQAMRDQLQATGAGSP